MIICICEGITERMLRTSIEQGAATLNELALVSRAGQDCGRCRVSMRALLHDSACRGVRDPVARDRMTPS